MIRKIEALRYRSMLDVNQSTGPFHILLGPNASGKSTFLDVIRLLGDLLKNGLPAAVNARTSNIYDLIWMNEGNRFEVAVELGIPEAQRKRLPQNGYEVARYEVAIGLNGDKELAILGENFWLMPMEEPEPEAQLEFPFSVQPRETLFSIEGKHRPKGWRKVASKTESGKDNFLSETTNWNNPFRTGPHRAALSGLTEDEDKFPVAIWARRLLMDGLQYLALNSEAMRKAAPPGSPVAFQPDGSNLPWAVENLLQKNHAAFGRWLAHIRTAIPEIRDIDTVERPEDKHRYLRIHYENGFRAPSWAVSDGTLRMLALTLIAYLEEPGRIYLIEEPENGIHPQAVETIFQSLSSTYACQVLCATHSPVFLSLAEPEHILCFAKDEKGAAAIVGGQEHPNLREWKRTADLGTLFATGVLG